MYDKIAFKEYASEFIGSSSISVDDCKNNNSDFIYKNYYIIEKFY